MMRDVKALIYCCTLLLFGCANQAHFDGPTLQQYQVPKHQLPAVTVAVHYKDRKPQKVCVDGQYGGRHCFDSIDRTRATIWKLLREAEAFEQVESVYSAIKADSQQDAYLLQLTYQQSKLNTPQEIRQNALLTVATLGFIPVNYRMKHTLKVRLVQNGKVLLLDEIVRTTEEPTAWYNHELNQRNAIRSLLKEMVFRLHDSDVFDGDAGGLIGSS